MPNTYFQFKRFRIEQADAAMKVTTEACILGAWVDDSLSPANVLDIGTGTGLLALMLAQKFSKAQIDAVEVEEAAYIQAKQNFSDSPWAERLQVFHQPVQTFDPDRRYDLIITNPPFFNRSLLSPQAAVNQARHDAGLLQVELVTAITRLLQNNGLVYVLYPPAEARLFMKVAGKQGLFPSKKLIIHTNQEKRASLSEGIRWIMQYSFAKGTPQEEELVIREADGSYTKQFVDLVRVYYLHL